MINLGSNTSARDVTLKSIREHLATSSPLNDTHRSSATLKIEPAQPDGDLFSFDTGVSVVERSSLVQTFKENVEAVGGHCIVVHNETEATQALTQIISDLQRTPLLIALSNSPLVQTVCKGIQIDVDEMTISPSRAELFSYDVGVSAAQYAIAETGTLVLESEAERHRLVSLVPPVHIAIVEADKICLTVAEALAKVNQGDNLSPTITFITGPSRTADIELTLTIGVHGPQELYVIVI